ncbi:DeoR/GlpR family DNA-binding transcription regulator [uncultured Clostridium sp.]|uniref:DeoR/GlpR family DNA-binding transcription regulator n=1 Tax=uncultured Clostridium sp. TaxID=59620 RepID=UPI0025D47972|nr:DeoR/GlpR family DNA-binding transcription regulator [uncultured Clostridium sp.]
MFIEERYKCILDLLEKDGKIFVKDLSERFNISESMIRKDLQTLEKQNLLKRTYGGAIKVTRKIINEISYLKRIHNDIDKKEKVAIKAYEMINDNDTIFLDSSSISYCIARLIAAGDKKVTVITNMIVMSSVIECTDNINLIYIGGNYSSIVGGTIGSQAINGIKNYCCNKAFVGCVGVNTETGNLSTSISEDAHTKRAIMDSSKERYLLILNDRFNIDAVYNFAKISEFDSIITEELPETAVTAELEKYNIHMI